MAVKRLKNKRPILLSLLLSALGYSLPYLYMVISGKNIPFWVYLVITLIYVFSGWSIYRKLRQVRLAAEIEKNAIL
ncbi:hypothetical protein [Pedobacter sandarakinus]|uniref:hypothetical protein n=1 Tax=Pedobacter sandarakinus TaxID=353156 RepID=UPI002246FD73|nr:hypothetical protein [Pedobacter sandarakinus]MCX2573180.1 hypothetical protein [Pedobacter sandarakinus]